MEATANNTEFTRYTVVIGTTTTADYDIHAYGCQHATRKAAFDIFGHASARSAEGLRRGLVRQYADQGRTESDYRIMDCCH